jgi:hypothetical protein
MTENPPEAGSAPPLPATSAPSDVIADREGDAISEAKSQMTGSAGSQTAWIMAKQSTPAVPLSGRAPEVLPPRASELLPPRAAKLLRPSRVRLFVVPVMVFGFTTLLVAIGVHRLKTVDHYESRLQTDTPVPTSPNQYENGSNELRTSSEDPSPEKSVIPAEPFKSFVLDAAQSYLATGSLRVPAAKGGNAQKGK